MALSFSIKKLTLLVTLCVGVQGSMNAAFLRDSKEGSRTSTKRCILAECKKGIELGKKVAPIVIATGLILAYYNYYYGDMTKGRDKIFDTLIGAWLIDRYIKEPAKDAQEVVLDSVNNLTEATIA